MGYINLISHHHLIACYLSIFLSTTFIITCYSFHTITTSTSIRYNYNTYNDHTMKLMMMSTSDRSDHDILLRALKGEVVERTPVWLMRQAGRYMSDFRAYSDKYPFRERSETPEIAIELSLQPWRSFGVDGVIMFSDILTPLPALGIDFTIIPGKGPKILKPIATLEDIQALGHIYDVDKQVPFLGPILKSLRHETEGKSTLIGFIGAPWTLAAYSVEGGHSKLCATFKKLCLEQPSLAHLLLDKLTESLCIYASYQIQSGAQVLQIFESWAHHLTEDQFVTYAKPYADRIATYLKQHHPNTPIVYFANGGSCYLHQQLDMNVNSLSIDWKISMKKAREVVGKSMVLCGNVDPIILYGSEKNIIHAVNQCIHEANGYHILNLGHGVEKDTPEEAVRIFVNAAKDIKL